MKLKFASRLNSFGQPKIKTQNLLARAARVTDLSYVDLNYPDHFRSISPRQLKEVLKRYNLKLNGLAMRYYGNPAFTAGAFTHPEPKIRRQAIELTLRGIDTLVAAGGSLLTVWLGQDGYDYPLQTDYDALFAYALSGLQTVARYHPQVNISLEYKPRGPRAFGILPDIGMTLLLIRESGLKNVGVTLDFCHALFAGEQPAASASLALKYGRLLGVHLNDGYGVQDDGLMVGSVHPFQTLELLETLNRWRYAGVIYFDTFPTHENPIEECKMNIVRVKTMVDLLMKIDRQQLAKIRQKQDTVALQKLIQSSFFAS